MRKLLLVAASCLLLSSAVAQVPNQSGFGVPNGSSGGGSPAGAAGGDLSGTYPNPTVSKINGNALGSPYMRVHQTTAQSLTTAVPAKITFDTVDFNVGSGWNATNHNFQPNVAGTYQICGGVVGAGNGSTASGDLYVVDISKNGIIGTGVRQAEFFGVMQAAIGSVPWAGGCAPVQLNGSTDTVEIDYTLTSATLTSLTTSTTNNRVYMSASYIGP